MKITIPMLVAYIFLSLISASAFAERSATELSRGRDSWKHIEVRNPGSGGVRGYYYAPPGYYPFYPNLGLPESYTDPLHGPTMEAWYQYHSTGPRRPDKPDISSSATTDIPPPGRPDKPDVSGSADSISIGSPRLVPNF